MNNLFFEINNLKYIINLQDIDTFRNKSSELWARFIRENEGSIMLRCLSEIYNFQKFKRILELGSGNGIQATLLSKHCKELFATDVNAELIQRNREHLRDYHNIKWKTVNCEDLSMFNDEYFDVVFSSNMIEHAENKNKCIEEMRRVVSKDGIIIVSVPSRVWRLASLFVFYLEEIKRVLNNRRLEIHKANVHGSYRNIFEEFVAYGKKRWLGLFDEHGFKAMKIIKYPFYHGYNNRHLWLLKVGNYFHLTSSYCFFFQKGAKGYTRGCC